MAPLCADCARAFIQAGVKQIFTTKNKFQSNNPMWDEHFKAAREMLKEANVELLELDRIG